MCFRYYDTIVEPEASKAEDLRPEKKEAVDIQMEPVAEMLRRSVRLLAESKGESWVHKASVWPMMKRLDSTFDLKDYGYARFSEMLKDMHAIIEVKKGETDHLLRVR